MTVAVEVLF